MRSFYTGLILDIYSIEHFKSKLLMALPKEAPN